MTNLSDPIKIIELFSQEEFDEETFLIHKVNANIFHLNTLSKLYVECLLQGISTEQIVSAIANRFNMSLGEVVKDFDDFLSSLTVTKPVSPPPLNSSLYLLEPSDFTHSTAAAMSDAKTYTAGGIIFHIRSEDPDCLALIEARLQPMRLYSHEKIEESCDIQILSGLNGFAVEVNGSIKIAVADGNWLDVLVMQAMLDQISAQSTETVLLHAAAIANEHGEAVIFAAPSGHGKSTLATFLTLQGYTYLGDDITVLNPSTGEAIPFPTAPNLKPGSWPLFNAALPQLTHQTVFRADIRPVRFANLVSEQPLRHSYKVKALIFPEFCGTCSATLTELSLADSFAYFSEIRRDGKPEQRAIRARQLIKFTKDTPCFSLEYGSLDSVQSLLLDLLADIKSRNYLK